MRGSNSLSPTAQAQLSGYELLYWLQGVLTRLRTISASFLLKGRVSRELIREQPRLALIQTVTAGYDAVDADTASRKDIATISPDGLLEDSRSCLAFVPRMARSTPR